MKKFITLLLTIILCFSIGACNNSTQEKTEENIEKTNNKKNTLNLWETTSTDIVDFSIDEAKLTIYASATHNGTYLAPVEDKTAYGAPTGKSIVVISFTVKNKDRAATMSIGHSAFGEYTSIYFENWKIKYDGKEYKINHLNGRATGFSLNPGTIIDRNTQSSIKEIPTSNNLLCAGNSSSYRVAGIVDFEPESLDDTFEIQVSIPDSKGKYNKLTYVTEYGEKTDEIFYNIGMELLNDKNYGYAMEKFKFAEGFLDAKEKYAEAELMYYLLSPTSEDASAYFKKNKDNYKLLNSEEIRQIIVGEWASSTTYGKPIVFCENGIVNNQYISDGTWKISSDCLEYKENDKDPANICEVRNVRDGIYLLYKDGTEPIISLQHIE